MNRAFLSRLCVVGLIGCLSSPIHAQNPEYTCTQVIGFSQVGLPSGGWYTTDGVFESIVDNDKWQLIWQLGGGVDQWANPEYSGWSLDVISPCAERSDAPERVVLSISGPHGDAVADWQTDIERVIRLIKEKLPSVEIILLQAVVGGPEDSPCVADRTVRAAWQHYPVREAIQTIAAADSAVAEGYAPVLSSCDGYRDALGHLTAEGAAEIGERIGRFYSVVSH
jgi:hypothetical protein